jgi:hypothetical protein
MRADQEAAFALAFSEIRRHFDDGSLMEEGRWERFTVLVAIATIDDDSFHGLLPIEVECDRGVDLRQAEVGSL